MDKLEMCSPDLTAQNIDKIIELFPSVLSETLDADGNAIRAVDFDLLRQELSDHVVEGSQERYQLDWPGKRAALYAANAPIAKTLRPVREQSVNFDNTQNLFIEGDNLDTLKLLQESYLGRIKLIYIDPPYNTGSDFVYRDNFAETRNEYLLRSGQVDEEGSRLVVNAESNGRFHSDWLSMMYPRLKRARDILTADGILAVSIDDGEQAGLRRILDEIFGERNLLAQLIWNKQHSQQQGIFKRYHEFVLIYARNATAVDFISGGEGVIEAGALKKVSRANPASEFDFPAGVRFDASDGTEISGTFGDSERVTVVRGVLRCRDGRTAEPVTLKAGWTQKNQMTSYFDGHETTDTRGQKVIEFFFNSAGKLKCIKERKRLTPPTIMPKYGMPSEHTNQLAELMGAPVFDNPKPVPLIQDLVSWFTADDDIIVDFFSGSSSTAHAVMLANAADDGRRRFIMVQLEERTKTDSEARKAGFETISALSQERIRRAAQQIASVELNTETLDLGFRTIRVDTTNMVDVHRAPDQLVQDELDLYINSVKPGRTNEDLLFQVLLDLGLELSMSISAVRIDGHEVLIVGNNIVLACFDDAVSSALIREIAKREPLQAVFRDSGFVSDSDRINAEQIFNELSPVTDVKVI